jgi:hypothetical protein
LNIPVVSFISAEKFVDFAIGRFKDSLSLMDSQIDSTKNKIKKIQNDYSKKIKVISSANHDELSDFFTNRYK